MYTSPARGAGEVGAKRLERALVAARSSLSRRAPARRPLPEAGEVYIETAVAAQREFALSLQPLVQERLGPCERVSGALNLSNSCYDRQLSIPVAPRR